MTASPESELSGNKQFDVPRENELIEEIKRRREDVLRGEDIIDDWRAALSEFERDLPPKISNDSLT